MNLSVTFAEFTCCFQSFPSSLLYPGWQWKLDTFKSKNPAHLTIQNNYDNSNQYNLEGPLLLQRASGFFCDKIRQLNDGTILWEMVRQAKGEILLQYHMNSEWNRLTLLRDETQSGGNAAFEYLSRILPGALLKQNILTFHAALLEYKGQAFAVLADSGVGKTTHARLWRDSKNALILNGDRALLKEVNGVWTAFGSPWSGTSGEQINRKAPLKGLVVLERGECNEAVQLSPFEGFAAVLGHLQSPAWDANLTNTAMEQLDSLLGQVPVYRLKCRPDIESTDVLEKTMIF